MSRSHHARAPAFMTTRAQINEATALIEAGFEYIQEIDRIRLYRKRK